MQLLKALLICSLVSSLHGMNPPAIHHDSNNQALCLPQMLLQLAVKYNEQKTINHVAQIVWTNQHEHCEKTLKELDLAGSPVIEAAKYGQAGAMDILLNAGFDINEQDEDGYTALIAAARYGHRKIVNGLILNGADLSLKTKDGKSAYDFALERDEVFPNDLKMTELIKEAIAGFEALVRIRNARTIENQLADALEQRMSELFRGQHTPIHRENWSSQDGYNPIIHEEIKREEDGMKVTPYTPDIFQNWYEKITEHKNAIEKQNSTDICSLLDL